MGLEMTKKIAAGIMKCGASRVRIRDSKAAEEALTRNDIRDLINNKKIVKIQKKGSSKFRWRKKLQQKKRGRMRGFGSRKGTRNARKPEKKSWMETVRPLRKLLKNLRENGQITARTYSKLYMRIKGGAFRSKSHLMLYVKERELLKKPKPKTVKRKPEKEKKPKKRNNSKTEKK
jgi:large subunit ribosomal protein L19e